jgi:[acyl-carrier-protein] S-malonyltransferase
MADAALAMADELASAPIMSPALPVVQNVTGRPEVDAEALRRGLAEQITGSVRWADSVRAMVAAGIDELIEFGPGSVLTGLAKRIVPELSSYNVNSMPSAEALPAWLMGVERAE